LKCYEHAHDAVLPGNTRRVPYDAAGGRRIRVIYKVVGRLVRCSASHHAKEREERDIDSICKRKVLAGSREYP
jgi:hypothetical protein